MSNSKKNNNNRPRCVSCDTKKEDAYKKMIENFAKSSSKDNVPWNKFEESPDDKKFDYYRKTHYYGLREKGAIGLQNLQNTCFMNSSLQCLSHIKILYNKLKESKREGNQLTEYFYKMLELMHEKKENKVFKPSDIFRAMCLKFPKYKSRQQQDANEFISNFLIAIHRELNSNYIHKKKFFDISNSEMKVAFDDFYFYEENKSPIIDIFYGNLININTCINGHITYYDFSAFNMLELSIFKLRDKAKIDLESLIKQNAENGPLGINEFCPKCQKKSPSFLAIKLFNAPDILIIFINRVINNIYYNNFIDFPTTLNLDGFIMEDKNSSKIFELIGIINHSGSANFGHYTAECKNFIDGKWYYFNDSWVSDSDLNQKKQRNISGNALILFYQKCNKSEKENEIITKDLKMHNNIITVNFIYPNQSELAYGNVNVGMSIGELRTVCLQNELIYYAIKTLDGNIINDSQKLSELIKSKDLKKITFYLEAIDTINIKFIDPWQSSMMINNVNRSITISELRKLFQEYCGKKSSDQWKIDGRVLENNQKLSDIIAKVSGINPVKNITISTVAPISSG